MSEFAPSIIATSMPNEAGLASAKPLTETTGDSEVSDFASLFGDMDFALDSPDDPENVPMLDDAVRPDALLISPLPLKDNLENSEIADSLSASLQPDGNMLPASSPLIAPNGLGTPADQDAITAMALAVDGKNGVTSSPQQTNLAVPGIQHTPAQLRDMMHANAMLSQDGEMLTMPRMDMGKQIEMLTNVSNQNTAVPVDVLSNSGTQLPAHALHGLQGATEFSNVLAASSRSPEAMTATLNQPQWNQQIGDRINWMISQGLRQADIRLNPAELGMLEVRVQMHGDQASIQFNTAHADVKDALESAMPRLREMLAANGLELADANVSQQGQQQAEHGKESSSSQLSHSTQSEVEQNIDQLATRSVTSNGVIDFYA